MVIKIIEDTEIIIGIIEIMIGEVEAEIVAEMVATTIIIGEITIGEIVETTQDENEATEIEVVIGEFNPMYLYNHRSRSQDILYKYLNSNVTCLKIGLNFPPKNSM